MADARTLQQSLVDLLRQNGTLTTPEVEQAFLRVPRHLFLPGEPLERAYEDAAIQVRVGLDGRWTSSSSQPSIMAIMLEQLALRPGLRVLEIGAGTGYNAALMAAIVGPQGAVTAVDIQPDLVEDARAHLRAAGLGWVSVAHGDGGYGWPAGAPYDRIILTASSATIAPAWREQLAEGGQLVLPLDLGGVQVSTAFEKRGEALVSRSLYNCGFMPLQGGFAMAPRWASLAPGVNLTCSRETNLDPAVLAGWLAGPEFPAALPVGLRLHTDDLWSGLLTWVSIYLPDRACALISDDEALAALEPPLSAPLRDPLIRYAQGERTAHMWLVLPAADARGAALLRRAQAPAEKGLFALEALPLGDGLEPARALADTLRAWDAAGRPGTARMRIRALDAATGAAPAPGEFLVPRPWTNFMVGYV